MIDNKFNIGDKVHCKGSCMVREMDGVIAAYKFNINSNVSPIAKTYLYLLFVDSGDCVYRLDKWEIDSYTTDGQAKFDEQALSRAVYGDWIREDILELIDDSTNEDRGGLRFL